MSVPQAEQLFPIPADPFIRAFAERPEMAGPTTVLDVGCGEGRNARYLAALGHDVTAIDPSLAEIAAAEAASRDVGAVALRYVNASFDQLVPSELRFGAVICNSVVHLVTPAARPRLIPTLQYLTRVNGLNAVSGYVVQPGTANHRNTANSLRPDELRQRYVADGWEILDYHETYLPNSYRQRQEFINSKASIIARRPGA